MIVFLLCGCASLPAGDDYTWDEWQVNTIELSGTTLHFEAPKYVYPPLKKQFETKVDIYDDSLYNDYGYRGVSEIGWYFMPQRKVRGELVLSVNLNKRPAEYVDKDFSISEYIEKQSRAYYETPGTNGYKYGSYIPIRFKYVARFSDAGPKWMAWDYDFSGTMSDSGERFTYPLDEIYDLSISVEFINNTSITQKNPRSFQPWYNEAQAIADRILASTRIERTTPFPDVEYGAPYIGVIDSSRVSYADKYSERPPIPSE